MFVWGFFAHSIELGGICLLPIMVWFVFSILGYDSLSLIRLVCSVFGKGAELPLVPKLFLEVS